MGKPSKAVLKFMEKFHVESDEVWEVHGTTWCVKHKALERVAAEVGIAWDKPELKVCDLAQGFVVVLISGKLGDRVEWSFGEASPKNNKNAYGVAMAEKRAKDRVILKLLAVHGDLYSEEEADDFKQNRRDAPDGYLDDDETIPAEHTIKRDDGIQVLTMDAQRPIFSELEKELNTCTTVEECKRWVVSAKSRASRLSGHWKDDLNKRYLTHLRSIEKRDADEYIERKTG